MLKHTSVRHHTAPPEIAGDSVKRVTRSRTKSMLPVVGTMRIFFAGRADAGDLPLTAGAVEAVEAVEAGAAETADPCNFGLSCD